MKLITEAISLPVLFQVPEGSETRRNELVLRAKEFASITDSTTQNSAVELARDIRTAIKDVEATRTDIKRPILDAGRQIDALAKDFSAPLVDELSRLEKLVTDFQLAERRRVEAEELKRREEIARLEQERLAREQEARKAVSGMASEAELAAAIQAEAEAKTSAEKAQAAIIAPLPSVIRAKGATTKRVLCYEVTDIRALYAARPELCNLEPKASAIRAVCVPELPVPGLRMWYEEQTSIRKW